MTRRATAETALGGDAPDERVDADAPRETISPRDLRDAAFRALSAAGMPAGSAARAAEMAEWLEVHDGEGLEAVAAALHTLDRPSAEAGPPADVGPSAEAGPPADVGPPADARTPGEGTRAPGGGTSAPGRDGALRVHGATALAVGPTAIDLACCSGQLLLIGLADPHRLDEPIVAAASRRIEPIAVIAATWACAAVPAGEGVAERSAAPDPTLDHDAVRLLVGEAAARRATGGTLRTGVGRGARRHEVRRHGLAVPAAPWRWVLGRSKDYLVADR